MFIDDVWVQCEYSVPSWEFESAIELIRNLPDWQREGLEGVTFSLYPVETYRFLVVYPTDANKLTRPIVLKWTSASTLNFEVQCDLSFNDKFKILTEKLNISPEDAANMAIRYALECGEIPLHVPSENSTPFPFLVGMATYSFFQQHKKRKSQLSDQYRYTPPIHEFVYGVELLYERLFPGALTQKEKDETHSLALSLIEAMKKTDTKHVDRNK